MIEYILSVSLLIVAVLIIRAIFRKTISPKVIYALWLVVVIRMVLPISLFEVTVTVPEFLHTEQNGNEEQSQTPPMLENGDNENDLTENIPIQTLPITPIIPGEQEQIPPAALPVTPIAPSEPEPVIPNEPDLIEPSTPGPETQIEPEKPIKKTISFTYVDVINTVWLAGVLAVEWWVIFTASSYEEKLRKNRKFYKNIGRTKVYISKSADVPCVAGVIPSVYITPESVNSGNDDLIMLHEYCHIRHGDHIWSVVRALALIVFWWNPLVWIAAGVSKRDAELACDDSVASKLSYEERIKYANILIDTIPQKRKYAVGLGSAPMKERIIMLTTEKKNKILCIVLAIILALCAVGCSFTSFGENETTQQNPETVPPAEDTEPDDTDADTESDVQTTQKPDSGETAPQTDTTKDSEENTANDNYRLIVNGKDITEGKYIFIYEDDTAELPFVAVMEALGVKIDRQGDIFTFVFEDYTLTLDIGKRDFGLPMPPGSTKCIRKIYDGEIVIDSTSASYFIAVKMGADMKIDYNEKTVTIGT